MAFAAGRHLTRCHRVEYKDKALKANIAVNDWSNLQLIRLVAIKKRFTKVNFSNTASDACYLRDCQFDSCNFTGAKFSSTNLHGAKFTGCIFDYGTFERTIIDVAVLTDNCPAHENQKMRFARSLRTKYQQIGDAAAANHAILVELDATEIHLRKSWKSNDHAREVGDALLFLANASQEQISPEYSSRSANITAIVPRLRAAVLKFLSAH